VHNAIKEKVFEALMAAGMPEIPHQFSVVPYPQIIPHTTLSQIETFIRIFDRVTTSPAWQKTITASAPEIARQPRSEVCFFSAWDFHLSPEQGWQLIECNDNGSGFLFASLINRLFYEVSGMENQRELDPSLTAPSFAKLVTHMVESEATAFFGRLPEGLFLILDDIESLQRGRFSRELFLLRDVFRPGGWLPTYTQALPEALGNAIRTR
jgi:hypothetical protein